MSNGTQTPEVRFEGFNDKWKQSKMGELAGIVRGASPRPIKDPKWFDRNSDIGWLRISDVTEQNGRIHRLEQKISELAEGKTRVLLNPHLLLSIAATVGKPVINYTKTGVHDGFLIFLSPQFNQEFMFQWLELFRPKWQKFGQPGSQVNLNSEIVKKKTLLLPEKNEQKVIGELLFNIDNLIALNQVELTKLQNFKQAMLQKMFPKEGERMPEVRFEGFEGEWEERILKDITKITTGFPFKSQLFNDDGDYLVISNSNIQDDSPYVDNVVGNRMFTRDLEYLEEYKLNIGDILVTMDGTVGRTAIVNNLNQVLAQRVGRISTYDNSNFMYQLLNAGQFSKVMTNISHGGTIKHISLGEIGEFATLVPDSSEEKELIGNYFFNLDKNIQAKQAELKKIKQFKQAMLNKLFV